MARPLKVARGKFLLRPLNVVLGAPSHVALLRALSGAGRGLTGGEVARAAGVAQRAAMEGLARLGGRDWYGERLRGGPISTNCGGTTASSGEQFLQAAGLARESEYWNAAGLLYVHSAIALADAVAIARRGEKSTSENHMDALALFEEALENVKGKNEAIKHLRRLIDEKNRVSYMGISIRRADLEKMETHADRFRAFAQRMPGNA